MPARPLSYACSVCKEYELPLRIYFGIEIRIVIQVLYIYRDIHIHTHLYPLTLMIQIKFLNSNPGVDRLSPRLVATQRLTGTTAGHVPASESKYPETPM